MVPIEREEFKKDFLRKYFLHEKKEVMIEEFINLREGSVVRGFLEVYPFV